MQAIFVFLIRLMRVAFLLIAIAMQIKTNIQDKIRSAKDVLLISTCIFSSHPANSLKMSSCKIWRCVLKSCVPRDFRWLIRPLERFRHTANARFRYFDSTEGRIRWRRRKIVAQKRTWTCRSEKTSVREAMVVELCLTTLCDDLPTISRRFVPLGQQKELLSVCLGIW